jgi:hypothetical protein
MTPRPSPLALRPREAAAALGISERKLWSLTQAGDVPHVKLDRVTLYPVAVLEDWLARCADTHKEVGE